MQFLLYIPLTSFAPKASSAAFSWRVMFEVLKMFRSRLFLLAGILLAASICFADKSSDKASDKMLEDWLPVSAQDQQIKDAPGNPGAPAIRLYFSYFRDDDARTLSEYHRIKILTAKGLEPQKYADVEIQIEPGMSLKEL